MKKLGRWWMAGGLVSAGTVLLPGVLGATHEVDHRYVVLGYVRDEQGRPVQGSRVSVLREKTGFSAGQRPTPTVSMS